MNEPVKTVSHTFHELGIHQDILKILDQKKLTTPTPIQHQAIPIAIEGKDVIGIAQTGTGKTFAFGLPLLQRLSEHGGRALIVLPTRELAFQVEESLKHFAPVFGIKMAVFVGGASMYKQREMLRNNPRILIATPGRLNDHLEQRTVTLKEVKILVLDEADRMLDMGFKPQIDKILKHVPKDRQTLLFSATMPKEILHLAAHEMKLPLRIEVAPQGTAAEKVEQEVIMVMKEGKMALLEKLLSGEPGSILVFSRTKHGAKKITKTLKDKGHKVAEIHANRSLIQRREALDGFKSGRYRVLIATDIAARGIDVTGIALVINFDLPDDPNDYVHRIGRTARAGREGKAISFATPDQRRDLQDIERLIRLPIKRSGFGDVSADASAPSIPRQQHRNNSSSGHRSGPRPGPRSGHRNRQGSGYRR